MSMKKIFVGLCVFIMTFFSAFSAFANEAPISNAPYLESVLFDNATIEGGFDKNKTVYDIVLENPSSSPVLKDYYVNGNANVFVTYNYDDSNHQTGMLLTLKFESGSIIYTFNYKNAEEYKITSNANLASLGCEYGEVQPNINKDDTSYKLYIPSDLTTLDIVPITEDVNAYCAPVSIELNKEQEPEISITVKASDGTTKNYKFKVKRLNKTVAEVNEEMKDKDFVSFVNGELFYQKPTFLVAFGSVVVGVIVVILLSIFTRRIVVNPYDAEEKEFYLPKEEQQK